MSVLLIERDKPWEDTDIYGYVCTCFAIQIDGQVNRQTDDIETKDLLMYLQTGERQTDGKTPMETFRNKQIDICIDKHVLQTKGQTGINKHNYLGVRMHVFSMTNRQKDTQACVRMCINHHTYIHCTYIHKNIHIYMQ